MFTFLGALAGAVVGGFSVLIKGENVWTGVKSGAVSGAILGAGTDLIAAGILTGGITTGIGVGLVAGAFGEVTYQANDYIDKNGSLEGFRLDREKVWASSLVTGIVNGVAGPITQFVDSVFAQPVESELIRSVARNQVKFTGIWMTETVTYAGNEILNRNGTKKKQHL